MSAKTLARQQAGRALRKLVNAPTVESVPEGRMVELPGRGSTFVVDVPGPEGAPTPPSSCCMRWAGLRT